MHYFVHFSASKPMETRRTCPTAKETKVTVYIPSSWLFTRDKILAAWLWALDKILSSLFFIMKN